MADGDHVRHRDIRSPQADNDIDDNDIEESEKLGESINLPPMLICRTTKTFCPLTEVVLWGLVHTKKCGPQ